MRDASMMPDTNSSSEPMTKDSVRSIWRGKGLWLQLSAVIGGVIMLISILVPWYILGRPEIVIDLPAFVNPNQANFSGGPSIFLVILLLNLVLSIGIFIGIGFRKPLLYGLFGLIAFLISLCYGVWVYVYFATMSVCAPEFCYGAPSVGWYLTLAGSLMSTFAGFRVYLFARAAGRPNLAG